MKRSIIFSLAALLSVGSISTISACFGSSSSNDDSDSGTNTDDDNQDEDNNNNSNNNNNNNTSNVENTADTCDDGNDNDNDDWTDCRDFSCQIPGTGCNIEGNSADLCQDGIDNDEDGFTDCEDTECTYFYDAASDRRIVQRDFAPFCFSETQAEEEVCGDGVDNDWNGFADCADNACKVPGTGCIEATTAECTDGIDNDNNMHADCADFNCMFTGTGDNRVVDMTIAPSCFAAEQADENTEAACTDGVDNDWNGYVDCADRACQINGVGCGSFENDEETCSDGINNDPENGNFTDCDDWSCCDTEVCAGVNPTCPEN